MFKITVRGRAYRFATLEDARKVAQEIFEKTGVIVGIEKAVATRRRELTVPEKHALRIARDTLRMPDPMVGVMGGPDKEQARQIIRELTGKEPRG